MPSSPTPATIIDNGDDVIPLAHLSRLPVSFDYAINNEAIPTSETLRDYDIIAEIIQTRQSETVTVISKKNQHPRLSTTTNRKDGGRGMNDVNIIILRVEE